jgi:K+-transporting ATPase ATPase C chain
MRDYSNSISNKMKNMLFGEFKRMLGENLRPSLKVVALMVMVAGITYPLLLVMIGEITLPFQSNGSLLTLDGKVIGSKLIAQEFKSEKLFHSRPAAESTSTVDPHITPEEAYTQVPRISKATGLPEYTLKTAIQLNIERNKVSNVLVFAPQYVNVLEVNLELITGYPETFSEFATNSNEVS